LVIIAKKCPPLPKSILVKLASKQLLHVLGLNVWGVGNVIRNAKPQMVKNEDLQKMIQFTRSTYA
jgi:hypothetical protein